MLKIVLVAAGVASGFALPAAAQGPAFPSPPLSGGAGAMLTAPMRSAASGPVAPAQTESARSAAYTGTEASARVPGASIDPVVRDSLGMEVGRIVRASASENQMGLVTLAAADGRTKTISAANLKLRSGTLFSDMSAASLWGE